MERYICIWAVATVSICMPMKFEKRSGKREDVRLALCRFFCIESFVLRTEGMRAILVYAANVLISFSRRSILLLKKNAV